MKRPPQISTLFLHSFLFFNDTATTEIYTLSLHDALPIWRKRQDRLHLVDGILVALLNIDEVIQVIRTSDDSAEARRRLIQVFDLSDIQAQYILDTPLRRLTRYDKLELEREQETLRDEIAALTEILENEDKLRDLVGGEMADLAKKFGSPRRTVLT